MELRSGIPIAMSVCMRSIGILLLVGSACSPQPTPSLAFAPCSGIEVAIGIKGVPRMCALIPGTGEYSTFAIAIDGTELVLGLHNVPDGTTLSVGSATGTSADGELLLRLPIADKLAGLSRSQLVGSEPVDLDATFKLTLARRAESAAKLPRFTLGSAMHDSAREVLIEKKLGLGAKAPTTPSIFLAARGLPAPVVGPAKTLADIDWVAVMEDKAALDTETCVYLDSRRSPKSFRKRVAVKTVTIHDRRTGLVIDRKDFVAPGDCPTRHAIGRGDIRIEFDQSNSYEPVLQWLRERVAPVNVTVTPTIDTSARPASARPATIEKRPPTASKRRARPIQEDRDEITDILENRRR
jgi:hypothetical protein